MRKRISLRWRQRCAGPALCVAIALPAGMALAAEEDAPEESSPAVQVASPIEEVVVVARYKSAATDVVAERIESDIPVDFLDAAAITRVGDSNVAAALRRVPGLTLVNDQFVYVRGLGERYSSSLLNGAQVPSPDLTRNVLPLDIFPARILDSVAVSKGYSPELPAAFGGGNIDVRTVALPESTVLSFRLNTGWNSESNDDGFTYSGGGDDNFGEDDGTRALSSTIAQAINTYRGSFDPQSIRNVLAQDGNFQSTDDALAVNRQLATSVNRNIDLRETSMDPDLSAAITVGHRFFLGENWEFGVLAQGAYDNNWRNRQRTTRNVGNPTTDFAITDRTINSVNVTGALNLGLRFTEDHEVKALSMLLRNTEDEASLGLTCAQGQFNDCGDIDNPTQGRVFQTRYEQRELEVLQFSGRHTLGLATLERLPRVFDWINDFRGAELTWYYSESEATTDLPQETRVGALDTLDPITGAVLDTRIRLVGTAADIRYSDLQDEVDSSGFDITIPVVGDRFDLEISGGGDFMRKSRFYDQVSLGLGSTTVGFNDVASGSFSTVFSDENILNPANGINLLLNVDAFEQTYAAGQINDAGYGKIDLLLNDTWRIAAGARYEQYTQVSVSIDPFEFNGSRLTQTPEEIRDSTIQTSEWYPSLAFTYIRPNFWAEEFQLRFGWSETVARPDLREVAQSTYIDPLTEARVRGNPTLRPSDLTNYDLRAEWFFGNGDTFTVSGFLKNIDAPIETVEGGATEDNILFNFVNADTAEVYGIEVEWLKSLGFASDWLGSWVDAFYFSGNVTLSDSDIDIPAIGGVGAITNSNRRLTQHSQWVTNFQLGFDSFDGKHGATLVFNSSGERIFFAGTDGRDDAFEQPFNSLDLVYNFYATERLILRLRAKNILNDNLEIEQDGVTLIEQDIGTTFLFDVRWDL